MTHSPRFLPVLSVLAAAMTLGHACTGASKQPPAERSADGKPAETGPGTSTVTSSGTNTVTSTGTTAGALDVVIVSAIGDENPERAASQQKFFQDLLAAVALKIGATDGRLALLASPTASISNVSVTVEGIGIDPTRVKQIAFEAAPRDALLAPIVAGCDAAASDLESSHQAGNVKVCGQTVPIPPHAWTWGADDLKGQLLGFLRPGARRVYVVVASSEAAVINGSEFLAITSLQNGGIAAKLHAVVPNGAPGSCNDRNLTATNLQAVAQQSGGTVLSFCEADWTPFVQALAGAL